MTFEEFKQNLSICSSEQSISLRETYIQSFIDTESYHYKTYINILNCYSDGLCYEGYLWDCLFHAEVVNFEYLTKSAAQLGNVYVLWDIHSKDRIWIPDYWKLGKSNVIQLSYGVLMNNLKYLPEDIYIFDNTFTWTLILTHEVIDEKRWCLKVGNI